MTINRIKIDVNTTPGNQLKLERVARKIQAADVAAAMDVSTGQVSYIENDRVNITPTTIQSYMNALESLTQEKEQ